MAPVVLPDAKPTVMKRCQQSTLKLNNILVTLLIITSRPDN